MSAVRELVCDPEWNGVSLTTIVPQNQIKPVWDARRYVTKRRGTKLAEHRSVVAVHQVDEPQGEGLLIERKGRAVPEVVYFVESRCRKQWKWFRAAVFWLLDRAASWFIGVLLGAIFLRSTTAYHAKTP